MDRESPISDSRKAANFVIPFPKTTDLTLRWAPESRTKSQDFQSMSPTLWEGQHVRLESFGGRSPDGARRTGSVPDDFRRFGRVPDGFPVNGVRERGVSPTACPSELISWRVDTGCVS